jgi:hypothetical protein
MLSLVCPDSNRILLELVLLFLLNGNSISTRSAKLAILEPADADENQIDQQVENP